MFVMDVPYVPAQEARIVLAQALTSGASPQPDYILKECQETESNIDDPTSAIRGIGPSEILANVLEKRNHPVIDTATVASIKITLP